MPRGLPKKVKISLEKSRDSALLAVETYNKPAVKFKSGGYIVLMIIAWTSLFHAIFFKRKLKPFYKENRRFKKRDGDYLYWELQTCIKKYYGSDSNHPIRRNLEFFIPLRNIIEHKSLPEIDSDIFAECQALLLNFDKIVEEEFGYKYCIRECLSFALQMYPSSSSLNNAVVSNPNAQTAVNFIQSFRSSITTDVLESGEYSFKAFLIQVANHESSNTVPIQFVRYDKLDAAQKENVSQIAALVKNKFVTVHVSNDDKIKPKDVVLRVQEGLGNAKVKRGTREVDKFNRDTHTRCWKKFGVRPESNTHQPEITKGEYCVYDAANDSYLYTDKWVDFLISELSKNEVYQSLYGS